MKRKNSGKLKICLAAVLCVLILTACGRASGRDPQAEAAQPLRIVATIFPPFDMARGISGGQAQVRMLLRPGEEVHSYEPTPQDILAIQDADLFLCVGGENDVWLEGILESMGENAPEVIRLLDLVETVTEEEKEGMTSREHHHHDEEEGESSEEEEEPDDGEGA